MSVTCIVLAAGASTRLGRPKQLVEIGGEPLMRRAARIAREVAPTIVVTRAELAFEGAVVNAAPDEGIASSIRLGVAACDGDVLLMTCDQPHITAEHLRALIAARAPIAATAYAGIVGVPAFFASRFREELMQLRGDAGARRVIEAHRDAVVAVPFEAAAVDIDRPGDL